MSKLLKVINRFCRVGLPRCRLKLIRRGGTRYPRRSYRGTRSKWPRLIRRPDEMSGVTITETPSSCAHTPPTGEGGGGKGVDRLARDKRSRHGDFVPGSAKIAPRLDDSSEVATLENSWSVHTNPTFSLIFKGSRVSSRAVSVARERETCEITRVGFYSL